MTKVWIVVPAHRPVLDLLHNQLTMLEGLVEQTVIVTNGHDPIRPAEVPRCVWTEDTESGVNISRWWNIGLDLVERLNDKPYHVAVLNADTLIQPEGIVRLSWELERSPAVMVGPHRSSGHHFETRTGQHGLGLRIPGYCFMLDSKAGLRADERFRWWCGDDDLEWRARQQGGTLLVGPIRFNHLGDGTPRGELRKLAEEDLWRFQEKWGIRPW